MLRLAPTPLALLLILLGIATPTEETLAGVAIADSAGCAWTAQRTATYPLATPLPGSAAWHLPSLLFNAGAEDPETDGGWPGTLPAQINGKGYPFGEPCRRSSGSVPPAVPRYHLYCVLRT